MNKTAMMMGMMIWAATGCVANAEDVADEQQLEAASEIDEVTIMLRDSVTRAPVAGALVFDGDRFATTNDAGVAYLEKTDGDIELSYLATGYRMHVVDIAASTWESERVGYVLPMVSVDDLAAVRERTDVSAATGHGFVLVPNRRFLEADLSEEHGPVDELGDFLIYTQVDAGETGLLIDHPEMECTATVSPSSLTVLPRVVTVVPEVFCDTPDSDPRPTLRDEISPF